MNFSEWMRTATAAEKERVFKQVMEDVEKEQNEIARQAINGQAAQSANAPKQEAH